MVGAHVHPPGVRGQVIDPVRDHHARLLIREAVVTDPHRGPPWPPLPARPGALADLLPLLSIHADYPLPPPPAARPPPRRPRPGPPPAPPPTPRRPAPPAPREPDAPPALPRRAGRRPRQQPLLPLIQMRGDLPEHRRQRLRRHIHDIHGT